MAHLHPNSDFPTKPSTPITCDQPGGGVIVHWELAWAKCRRSIIRSFFPGHIRRMEALRVAQCPNCTHDVIDSRDLKYCQSLCGVRFDPLKDPYAWRDHTYFARHGWAEIFVLGAPLALLALTGLILGFMGHIWGWGLTLVALPFLAFVPAFFRNPKRTIPTAPGLGISPADGTVTHVDETEEPGFPGGRAKRISLFLSVFNVHLNRIPLDGTVEAIAYYPGEYLDARHSECSKRNEQLWIDLRDNQGQLWRVRQVSGAIARRIVCQLKPGQVVKRGELFGLIKFGSRTELLWETTAPWVPQVNVGQTVKGGETVLVKCSTPGA